MHKTIEPAILYFGTPVVLISTVNVDGSINVAPMSSIWWLGYSAMIGLDASSQTAENLLRTRECVLNMASAENVDAVDRLAKTTGRKKVPLHKKAIGYRYEADKLNVSGFTTEASMSVLAPRLKECPVQLEAKLAKVVEFGRDNVKTAIPMGAFELNIEKVHVDESLLIEPNRPYVDPDKWHPLIMSFRKFYSTGDYIHESRLGQGSESQYAPWKKIGFKKKVLNWLLARNTHRYKQSLREHSDN